MGLADQYKLRRCDVEFWSGVIDFHAAPIVAGSSPTMLEVGQFAGTPSVPLPAMGSGDRVVACPTSNPGVGWKIIIVAGATPRLFFLFVNPRVADFPSPDTTTWNLIFFHDPTIVDARGA